MGIVRGHYDTNTYSRDSGSTVRGRRGGASEDRGQGARPISAAVIFAALCLELKAVAPRASIEKTVQQAAEAGRRCLQVQVLGDVPCDY